MDYPIKLHMEVVIDSAHFLDGYEGKCREVHGHAWRIRIWIKGHSSQLDKLGILFDFTNVQYIKNLYDHKLLNKCMPFINDFNPTAENIALTIYHQLKELCKIDLSFVVRVYETSIGKECWAQTGDWEENA